MAFEKTLDLMRLAEMAAARHKGVSLVEVSAELGVNLRTAQRMIRGWRRRFQASSSRPTKIGGVGGS